MQTPTTVNPMQLVNATDFDRALFKYVAQHQCTQMAAFEALNEIYTNAFNRPRYATFESYRLTRTRRIKQNR